MRREPPDPKNTASKTFSYKQEIIHDVAELSKQKKTRKKKKNTKDQKKKSSAKKRKEEEEEEKEEQELEEQEEEEEEIREKKKLQRPRADEDSNTSGACPVLSPEDLKNCSETAMQAAVTAALSVSAAGQQGVVGQQGGENACKLIFPDHSKPVCKIPEGECVAAEA
eukprot:g64263.t1